MPRATVSEKAPANSNNLIQTNTQTPSAASHTQKCSQINTKPGAPPTNKSENPNQTTTTEIHSIYKTLPKAMTSFCRMKYDESGGKGSRKSIYLEDSQVYLVFTVRPKLIRWFLEKKMLPILYP